MCTYVKTWYKSHTFHWRLLPLESEKCVFFFLLSLYIVQGIQYRLISAALTSLEVRNYALITCMRLLRVSRTRVLKFPYRDQYSLAKHYRTAMHAFLPTAVLY